MKIHHLNCGTLKPIYPPIPVVCYCLLLDTSDGLILVDTGLGTRDYTEPSLAMRLFTWANRIPRDLEETALRQVSRLGHEPTDLHDIVLTHLHLDHSGGLPDFPWARVHIHGLEHAAATRPEGLRSRIDYIPDHWRHGPNWVLHSAIDKDWFGFEAIEVCVGDGWEVLLIPLPGHSRGHCGVAVRADGGWLFHFGDAASPFYDHRWTDRYGRPPAWLVKLAGSEAQQGRLEELWRGHGDSVQFIFAHDALGLADRQVAEGVRK